MDQPVRYAVTEDESRISDKGCISLDQEHSSAGGISAQLAPEFSRKLSFVEHQDEEVADTHTDGIGNTFSDSVPLPPPPPPPHHLGAAGNSNSDIMQNLVKQISAAEEVKQLFSCNCGEHFEKSTQLAAHKRWSCRLTEKTAQCDVCKNRFASDMGLKRHMKHAHGGVYSCDSCNLRFPNKIKLTRHWMEAHYSDGPEQSRVLRCFECGDTNFENKFEVECHLVLHKFEKHQQKLAQTTPDSQPFETPHPHFPPPHFMRAMRHPPPPFHHPYGFGPQWSNCFLRPPPPPLFPWPCSSFMPFRPPFPLAPQRHCRFTSRMGSFTTKLDDDASSPKASTVYETAPPMTGGSAAPASNPEKKDLPHHNHEFIESNEFPYFFHGPYDYRHQRHHFQKTHDHHDKKKWKKYFKLMFKGRVPSMFTRPPPQSESNQSQPPQTHEQATQAEPEQHTGSKTCEFKMACKFCDKIIETNKVSWHQKKECPVLLAHRCAVCERVFKKKHFLIRHMHEQNHFSMGSSQSEANVSSVSSLREKLDSSLHLENPAVELEMVGKVDEPKRQRAPMNKSSGQHLQCHTCKHLCSSTENLMEHLKDHINLVQAVQKVWEWTSKSSEYFFLKNDDDEDGLDDEDSTSAATTSYFDSEITSTASSVAQEGNTSGNFSSLDATASSDSKWSKPHKKLKRHLRGEVTVCEFCQEKFAFRKDLHYHMETKHKDSTLECPVCHKKFSWKKRGKFYERHVNSHYGVKIYKHECGVCGKTFLENSKLRAHMSLHNSDLLHKCNMCGRGYANKSSLVRHERKHTGVKPYQCKVCSDSFMEKRELLRHSTTHTGLSPFNCQECGKGFTLKTSLMSHLRKKHSSVDKPGHPE